MLILFIGFSCQAENILLWDDFQFDTILLFTFLISSGLFRLPAILPVAPTPGPFLWPLALAALLQRWAPRLRTLALLRKRCRFWAPDPLRKLVLHRSLRNPRCEPCGTPGVRFEKVFFDMDPDLNLQLRRAKGF